MSEIIFIVEEAEEGGYTAKAMDYSIFTEGETMEEVKNNITEAIHCHFDEKMEKPKLAYLHFVKNEILAIA